jgi:hypothetical protein
VGRLAVGVVVGCRWWRRGWQEPAEWEVRRGRVIGEIVLDPTEDEDPTRCLLHLRVPGMLVSDPADPQPADTRLGPREAWLLRNFASLGEEP